MLSKQDYFIHFARLFFACLLIGISSFISHIWHVYQPIYLAFRCQTIQIHDYPLNVDYLLDLLHSSLVIYLIYHLIRLLIFHVQLKQLKNKQNYYAHLYREKPNNRLL